VDILVSYTAYTNEDKKRYPPCIKYCVPSVNSPEYNTKKFIKNVNSSGEVYILKNSKICGGRERKSSLYIRKYS
jgi:hypothetical protein